MAKIICDIFMYIFESLLLYHYANDLFFSKQKTIVKIFSVAIINIISCAIYQFGNGALNGTVLIVLYFLEFWLIFNAQIKNAFFHSVLFISVMTVSEITVINLCSVIFDDFAAMASNISAYIFVIVTSKLIYLLIMLIIKKLCVNRMQNKQGDSFYWVLFLFPLSSMIMSILFFYIADDVEISDEARILVSGMFIFLLFADLVI